MESRNKKYSRTSICVIALVCFFFSFQSYGNVIPASERQAEFSSFIVPAKGESVLVECPVVPVASAITKNYSHHTPAKGRDITRKDFNPMCGVGTFQNFYKNHFPDQKQHSLRLHLALCVLLI